MCVCGRWQLHGMSQEATLALFCQHYESVKTDPTGKSHQNIRAFMASGWEGLEMDGDPALVKLSEASPEQIDSI